jgi:hypothetical protein
MGENISMPVGGKNSTYHKKKDGWEYWSYPFSSTVLIAEKKLLWYDEDKLTDLWLELKRIGVRLCWAEASDTSHAYTKKNCRIELYKRYPEDTPFQDKIRDMEEVIERYGL